MYLPLLFILTSSSFITGLYFNGNSVGSLDILTNHAQPIHADVKTDGLTEKNAQCYTYINLSLHILK
ncbi:unnamed protein product [Leptidea sinapis]|uniref:Uncharacterized protein n=1 Tax=Leptidea sinapis TaxID=189913 RepID=A0A5E4QGY3_9NEOP|nr:unnamed protein product [Leptidea sinapis]